MDLKGSLTDTNLRIFPTEKLVNFIKTIPPLDNLPHNILQIIKSNTSNVFTSYKLQDIKPVQLNNIDIEKIKKIKEDFEGNCTMKDKSVANESEMHSKNKEEEEINGDEENSPNPQFEIKENTFETKVEKKGNADNKIEANSGNKISLEENVNRFSFENNTDIGPFLVTSDIDWLYDYIKTRRNNGEEDIPYLHMLLDGVSIKVPENETLKRNPILEARCVKLRAQQEAREYRKMTKSVDNVRMRFPEDSISYQLKQLNRQLIAIGQFIISIFAGFLFGFRGVEWMVGNLDFGFRLLLGVMCALVIALAEIYFLAKKLNEELCVPETVQLGGPVKFADQDSYVNKNNENSITKEHQD